MPTVRSLRFFFFFNDTATTEIYTLSLHDALPISAHRRGARLACGDREGRTREARARRGGRPPRRRDPRRGRRVGGGPRPRVRAEWSLRRNGCARMTEGPRRTCLGCRRVQPKGALVRLVRGRDG